MERLSEKFKIYTDGDYKEDPQLLLDKVYEFSKKHPTIINRDEAINENLKFIIQKTSPSATDLQKLRTYHKYFTQKGETENIERVESEIQKITGRPFEEHVLPTDPEVIPMMIEDVPDLDTGKPLRRSKRLSARRKHVYVSEEIERNDAFSSEERKKLSNFLRTKKLYVNLWNEIKEESKYDLGSQILTHEDQYYIYQLGESQKSKRKAKLINLLRQKVL